MVLLINLDWNLDAPELDDIWTECELLDMPVFIHPWDMPQDKRMHKYWFPWLIGMPCETTVATFVWWFFTKSSSEA